MLSTYAWAGALLFARIGAVLMLAPGWGESAVPVRFRLVAVLLSTAVLAPTLAAQLPEAPPTVGLAVVQVISEVLVGLMIGAVGRLMMSALQVAGQVIGMQSGLGFAQQLDPTIGQSGALIGVFLSMTAIVLIFATGIHRLMLQAAADSYQIFRPGDPLAMGDAAEWAVEAVSAAFRIGLQMAAPIVVFAMVFNLAVGLVSRLIPQVQIYFIAMPSQIMVGLAILAFVLGGGLLIWLEALERVARLESPY